MASVQTKAARRRRGFRVERSLRHGGLRRLPLCKQGTRLMSLQNMLRISDLRALARPLTDEEVRCRGDIGRGSGGGRRRSANARIGDEPALHRAHAEWVAWQAASRCRLV